MVQRGWWVRLAALLAAELLTAIPASTGGGSGGGSGGGAAATPEPMDQETSHSQIARLLRKAMDAASVFIPSSWLSAFPQPLSTVELAERWGYPVETWQVETSDGHVLLAHRLPAPGRPAVLLLHGMFCSSAEWLIVGPNRSLGFQLHDMGYDVWLANFRGNPYSLGHRGITTLQAAFWNYSFHEHGLLDLQATLDEVRNNTQAAVSVVAHSLGTTALLALLAEQPDYNDLVQHAVLLGPVASLRGVRSPFLRVVAHYGHVVGRLLGVLGVEQVLVMGGVTSRIASLLCHPSAPTADMCKLAVFAVAGHSPDLFDAELLPQVVIQYAAGASIRTLVHLSECLVAGAFLKPAPPDQDADEVLEYNLSAVDVPLTLVYSNNDLISGPQEAEWLFSKTKNISTVYEVPLQTFNHMDYLYAKDAKVHIYDYVAEDIARNLPDGTAEPEGTTKPEGTETERTTEPEGIPEPEGTEDAEGTEPTDDTGSADDDDNTVTIEPHL